MGFIISALFLLYILSSPCWAQYQSEYPSFYQFGDSIADTGNAILLQPFGPNLPSNRKPYGTTSPGTPTGRWSDGLLPVDLLAHDIGPNPGTTYFAPSVATPYLAHNWDSLYAYGVNFAVAGSTALDNATLAKHGIKTPKIPDLGQQINWLYSFLEAFCVGIVPDVYNVGWLKVCVVRFLQGPVPVFFGPFGSTDIMTAIVEGKSFDEITALASLIVDSIIQGIEKLIPLGLTMVAIPLNFPLGCFPFAIEYYSCNSNITFDQYGCVEDVNNIIMHQNQLLTTAVDTLSQNTPDSIIFTVDYYTLLVNYISNSSYGFNQSTVLESCCGNGMFNLSSEFCGGPNASVCDNPDQYVFWDGISLTSAAYQGTLNVYYEALARVLLGT